MEPRVHNLKTLPTYFEAVKRGEKNFEVRRDDRGFQKGDILALRLWYPPEPATKFGAAQEGRYAPANKVGEHYNEVRRRITYILTGAQFGIEAGYVVMGLEPVMETTG